MSEQIWGEMCEIVADFEALSGLRADILYLGFSEWGRFREYCRTAHEYALTATNNRVAGFRVLYVAAPSHMAAGKGPYSTH